MVMKALQCTVFLMFAGSSHAVDCPDAATEEAREASHLCADGEEPRCVDTSKAQDWKKDEVWNQMLLPQWSHEVGEHICEKPSYPMCRDDLGEFTSFMNPCKVQAQASRMQQRPAGDNQQSGGNQQPGGSNTQSSSPTLTGSIHEASLLGDVALTTATGTDPGTNQFFDVGENVFAPFEAGFTAQQAARLEDLGCTVPSDGFLPGGIDTLNAEQVVAHACGVTLPHDENSSYVSLLDECGGHTGDYHFHERLSCLYSESGGHSTKVAEAMTQIQNYGYFVYGKWEDYDNGILPQLDACGGHFGFTPESPSQEVYHYHVQDNPPFVIGCFGPNDDGSLVTLQQCREYSGGCDDGDETTITFASGSKKYDLWCSCFDAEGLNTADSMVELAVFGGTATPSPAAEGGTPSPTAETTPAVTRSPTGEPHTSSRAATLAGGGKVALFTLSGTGLLLPLF